MMESMFKSMVKALGFDEEDLKQLALVGIKEIAKKLSGEVKYKVEENTDGTKTLYILIKLEGVREL